jgi:glutaredoxin-related protein
VFSKRSPFNHRDDVDDVVLLFTDGRPKPEDEQTAMANKFAQILKNRNVTIIGLAVRVPGKVEEFKPNIERWATSPQLVYEAKIDNLDNVISKLVQASCNETREGKLILSA